MVQYMILDLKIWTMFATAAIDFSQGDSIFVDSDGNQIVYQEESSDTYALCTHSMVPATFIPIQKILLVMHC